MQTTATSFTGEEKVKKETIKKARREKMKIFDVSAGEMIKVTPTKYFLDSLKESEEDIKAGRVITFNSPKEMIEYLEKEIEDERGKQSSN